MAGLRYSALEIGLGPLASMRTLGGILAGTLLVIILWDVFETIILPRRITRKFRLARLFYLFTWQPWRRVARLIPNPNRREAFLSFFGPLSLLFLFAVWSFGIILAFAGLHWANGSAVFVPAAFQTHAPNFWTDVYMSGTTMFTLGLGDVTPANSIARGITIWEAGIGFGFLAVVISYLPVLYGAFSRREVNISLLDARAGSPPTAGEFMRRHVEGRSVESLTRYLQEWENWSAELMESHLSYPVLCYFRSLHNNQSWLSALTTVLDVSALLIAYADGELLWQAKLTFAMSRHAAVDLAQVLNVKKRAPSQERLRPEDLVMLRGLLDKAGLSAPCCDEHRLSELREMYEPYVEPLTARLVMPVMGWTAPPELLQNWRTSAWAKISGDGNAAVGSSRRDGD